MHKRISNKDFTIIALVRSDPRYIKAKKQIDELKSELIKEYKGKIKHGEHNNTIV